MDGKENTQTLDHVLFDEPFEGKDFLALDHVLFDEPFEGCSPGSSRESANSYSSCSSPEVDVVAFTPRPPENTSDDDQKRYFCQRCLNHKQQHPRKGHKPFCQYANCECTDCRMVEERRRLNNMLSRRRLDTDYGETKGVGKKVRDPKCALCSAHGDKQPLRGHKKAQCPFLKCGCHLCGLVENRRTLMARQIKLRRDQQKQRKAQLLANASNTQTSSNTPTSQTHNTTKEGDFIQSERKAITEPLRVPPIMPVTMKLDCNTPFAPLLLQPSTILSPSALLIPSMEAFDVHVMQLANYHPIITPYSFHFTPIFPYTTSLPFLSTP
uniref:DM domain-containing protein n=1 Tax=Ascaris lumbricoides TaxID=6252 RepID=A0A0M3IKT7_ASCLU